MEAKAEIETAVIRFGEAWADGDAATLDTMLSPTFTHTDINGKFTDRATWLSMLSGMFNVSEAEAAAIRAAYERDGELAAAVEAASALSGHRQHGQGAGVR